MSDYNFMKSGSGNDRNFSDDDIEKIQALVMLFAENALKMATTYVEHANRSIIQIQDIQNCMKIEAMTFCKKQDTIQLAAELLNDLKNNPDDDDEDLSDLITDDEEEFTLSNCDCPLCVIVKHLNNYWKNWEPQTPLERSLKKNIDKFP